MSDHATSRLRLALLVLTLSLVAAAWSYQIPDARAAESSRKRAVILSLEGLSLDDIDPDTTPNLYELFSNEAAGLIGMRKAFNYANVPSAYYATLGAGAPVSGYEVPSRDSARMLWTQKNLFTGDAPNRPRDEWLQARAKAIVEVNEDKRTTGEFGGLGRTLQEKGMVVGAVGSNGGLDFLDMVMGPSGLIGRVAIVEDGAFETKRADTDPNLFAGWAREFYKDSDLILASYSDVRQIDESERSIREKPAARRKAVDRADETVGRVADFISGDDLLVVMLPFGGDSVAAGLAGDLISEGEPLTPVAFRSPRTNGLLTSGSTRRKGVISITDIQPTLLEHFGLETAGTRGMPAAIREHNGDTLAFLKQTSDYAFLQEASRMPILAPVALWIGLVLTTLLVLVKLQVDGAHRTRRILLLSTFLVPAALAVPPLVGVSTTTEALISVVLVMSMAVPVAFVFRRPLTALAVVSGFVPTLYLLDLVFGTGIGQGALLAGSVMKGGRYYGVGNPLMGIILIFTILFIAAAISARPALVTRTPGKLGLVGLLAVVAIGVGGAGLGANFGGLVTMAITFPFLFFRLALSGRGKPWFWLLLSVGGVALIVLSDVALGGTSQSHIGRMFSTLGGNVGSALKMVRFKAAYNIETTRLFLWRLGGVFGLIPMVFLLYISAGRLQDRLNDLPVFQRALPAIYLGATVSLLVNDTGFEPFMIVLIYTLAAALYFFSSVDMPAADDLELTPVTDNERMFA